MGKKAEQTTAHQKHISLNILGLNLELLKESVTEPVAIIGHKRDVMTVLFAMSPSPSCFVSSTSLLNGSL